jgi:hypothetical protein
MRGTLHAHILLWSHPEDIDKVTQEITASLPVPYQSVTNKSGQQVRAKNE